MDFVELPKRNIVDVVPGAGAVPAYGDAAIRTGEHMIAIGGVDPEGVKVGVDGALALHEGLAAVFGHVKRRPEHPNLVFVVWIDTHLAVIGRPRIRGTH